MRIGIDIDNVISSFDEALLEAFLTHNRELGYSNEINEKADYITKGMFRWREGEVEKFYQENIEKIVNRLHVKKGAKEYIDQLKEDGHDIYIITGRDNGEHSNPYDDTKKWLDRNLIKYDKLIFTDSYYNDPHGKGKKCAENQVDIMIDDSIQICKDCMNYGVTVLLMDTLYNRTDHTLLRVHSWREIYEYIKNNRQKKKVILDTDAYNECDDQFALAYMIKSQDIFQIEAITVAPYRNQFCTIKEGLEKSYQEIFKICDWLRFDSHNKIFKGAEDFMIDGYENDNEAVNKIIEIALKNEKTYIMAIGAITNVALAIKKEPRIIDKIEVIWLGGHSLLQDNNIETNFKDRLAVKIVFDSQVKLTIIPAKNVASNLTTSIYELNYHLKDKNELCNYLIERFYHDGYHGIQERRVIWDISVIAYLINKAWFETKCISVPNIKEDGSYEQTENKHKITMVNYLNANKIYTDLFKKLLQ